MGSHGAQQIYPNPNSNTNTNPKPSPNPLLSTKGCMGSHGAQQMYRELDQLHLVQRITNLESYMNLNRDLPSHQHCPSTPWPQITGNPNPNPNPSTPWPQITGK
jgi:hypothetical protein